jgi:hypothetical protein
VNFRRQKSGDEEGAIACDINVEFTSDGPTLMEQIAVADPPKGWKETFWDKEGVPRELCIESMKVDREFTALEMTVESQQGDLFDDGADTMAGLLANAKKIVVSPMPGHCLRVQCQLQTEPPHELWDNLPALIKENVLLTLLRGNEDAEAGEPVGPEGQEAAAG